MLGTLHICLITESAKADAAALRLMAPAVEENLLHAWEAWRDGLPSMFRGAPPVVVQHDDEPMPPWGEGGAFYVPLRVVESTSRNPGTLAMHHVVDGRPTARVYVDSASGINNGRESVVELICHEALEILCNPFLTHWDEWPKQPRRWVPREICDPPQTSYDASTRDPGGKLWQLANFVLPSWYGFKPREFKDNGSPRYDYSGEFSEPGELGPEGYTLVRDRQWNVQSVRGAARIGESSAPGKHMGRTARLIEVAGMLKGSVGA